MAARAMDITGMITPVARRSVAGITPEFYFQKTIDNSRLVRVSDPQRRREVRMFSAVVSLFFLMAMFYTWQHFRSLEYGYQIESLKIQRDNMVEVNRELHLEDATLRNPERIDVMARKLGLQSPQAGQVMHLEATVDPMAPVMARASGIQVVDSNWQ